MAVMKNTLSLILLLTIIWASFLLVTYILASTLFPALEQADGDLATSLARVVIGVSTFSAWVYGWYRLTRFWLYRLLLREGG